MPLSTILQIGKDINGVPSDSIHLTADNYSITLPAGVPTSLVVPPDVDRAFFAYGNAGDVWVAINEVASIPAGAFTQNTFQLNPVSRFVYPGQTLSFICAFMNGLQVAFYRT